MHQKPRSGPPRSRASQRQTVASDFSFRFGSRSISESNYCALLLAKPPPLVYRTEQARISLSSVKYIIAAKANIGFSCRPVFVANFGSVQPLPVPQPAQIGFRQ